jgi:hypothetical protein
MREEPRQVTTFCPRCGKPIIWSVPAFADGEQLEVSGWVCFCPLSDDEWDELGSEAVAALEAQEEDR